MKNTLLIAGVFAGAVVAAVLAWAVFGGSGERRQAALQEPTQSGSIGDLTLDGVSGASQLPIESFNWHAAWAGGSNPVAVDPLEVLRRPGEVSPALFTALPTHANVGSGEINLMEPESRPYLRFEVTGNPRLTDVGPGNHEKVGVATNAYPQASGYSVTAGDGPEPTPDESMIIGQMTFPNERGGLPIYAVSGGPTWPAGATHVYANPIVVRRPLDHLAEALWTDLAQQTNLALSAPIRIDVRDPGERPHISYDLGGVVKVRSLTTSAAAGRTPTEEFELTYRTLTMRSATGTVCFDFQGQVSC
jgi:hypothetical protein